MKTLVAYFSYSGGTARAAKTVAEAAGADLFEIEPETPYSSNYNCCIGDAQAEKRRNARPKLKEQFPAERFADYGVVFLGYPIWWYDAPMIIYAFLQTLDFTGKTVIPFALSGGSGMSGSDDIIRGLLRGAEVKKGTMLNGYPKERIVAWTEEQLESITKRKLGGTEQS